MRCMQEVIQEYHWILLSRTSMCETDCQSSMVFRVAYTQDVNRVISKEQTCRNTQTYGI
jgi:hypothetical protein